MWLDKLLNFLLRTKWGLMILFTSVFGCSFVFSGCMLFDTLACMCEGAGCGEDNCFSECNTTCDTCFNGSGDDSCALAGCLFGDGCLTSCGNCTADCGGCNRTCFTDCGVGCNDGCKFGNFTVDCSGNTSTTGHSITYTVYTEQGNYVRSFDKHYGKREKITLVSDFVDTAYYQVLGFYKEFDHGEFTGELGDADGNIVTKDNLNDYDVIYVKVSEKYIGDTKDIVFSVSPESLADEFYLGSYSVTLGAPLGEFPTAPEIEGYNFSHWELAGGTRLGGDILRPDAIVHAKDWGVGNSMTISVTAVYEPISYEATFHLMELVDGRYQEKTYTRKFSNGTTIADANGWYEEKYFETDYGKVVGWSTEEDPAPDAAPLPEATPLEAEANYYAIYQRYVKMTYHSYHGYEDTDANKYIPEERYYETQQINLPQPESQGIYTFSGWTTEPEGEGRLYSGGGSFTITAEITDLYALWTATNEYFVTYYIIQENGTPQSIGLQRYQFSETDPITLSHGDGSDNVDLRSRFGYTFAGWCRQRDFSDEAIFELPAGTYGNIALYAKFEPEMFTIRFVPGTGASMSAQTVQIPYGSPVGYQLEVPVSNGKTFTGWYTAGGTQVTDGEGKLVKAFREDTLGTITNKTVQLIARWTDSTYTVTFKVEDASVSYTPVTVQRKYNEEIGQVTLTEPSKPGYQFEGWYEGSTEYDPSTVVTRDITFTAKFSPKTYELTLDAAGGTVNGESTTTFKVTYGEKPTLPIPTHPEGKSFLGWFDQAGHQYTYDDGILIDPYNTDGEITLYAHWA